MRPGRAAGPFAWSALCGALRFTDAEHEHAVSLDLRFQHVSRLIEEIGNINRRERVRAFDDEDRAGPHARQRLARLERGQGAFQPPKVQVRLGHEALDIVRGPHNYAGRVNKQEGARAALQESAP
jgi:hypothetical protein